MLSLISPDLLTDHPPIRSAAYNVVSAVSLRRYLAGSCLRPAQVAGCYARRSLLPDQRPGQSCSPIRRLVRYFELSSSWPRQRGTWHLQSAVFTIAGGVNTSRRQRTLQSGASSLHGGGLDFIADCMRGCPIPILLRHLCDQYPIEIDRVQSPRHYRTDGPYRYRKRP